MKIISSLFKKLMVLRAGVVNINQFLQ